MQKTCVRSKLCECFGDNPRYITLANKEHNGRFRIPPDQIAQQLVERITKQFRSVPELALGIKYRAAMELYEDVGLALTAERLAGRRPEPIV